MLENLNISYAPIDELFLDPLNPRLGRRFASETLKQSQVLDAMRDWTLEELAESFLANGFWPQEALIAVREKCEGIEGRLVIVEGNRRLAALKCIEQAASGQKSPRFWRDLVKNHEVPGALLKQVPYIEVPSRKDVAEYLGFRHVTGIKEWKPAEKAQYIAKLIDDLGLSYDDVRRKIGSKTPTVRQHYISYKLLLQMQEQDEIAIDKVEEKFSVLYLSLRTQGAQQYLRIDIHAPPEKARTPVPKEAYENLVRFARWLFGDDKRPPLFTDSRNVDNFGRVLESAEGVEYLERTPEPSFELAVRKAGVGEEEVQQLILG
jgi:ParB-like chromosome segregation protein Spo0J